MSEALKISILTMFPESFASFLETPVIKRCMERGIVELELVDIRDFAGGSFRHIDDSPYGGGPGMLLRCDVVHRALQSVQTEDSHVVLLSPAGKTFTQQRAAAYGKEKHLVLICGHYEGLDSRIEDYADELVSMGDFILTGGELPAMTITDAAARLLDGALRREATAEESFSAGLLEYPQYTKPREYEGKTVPEVLLGGNHEAVQRWREQQAVERTKRLRPDLWEKYAQKKEL